MVYSWAVSPGGGVRLDRRSRLTFGTRRKTFNNNMCSYDDEKDDLVHEGSTFERRETQGLLRSSSSSWGAHEGSLKALSSVPITEKAWGQGAPGVMKGPCKAGGLGPVSRVCP